MWKLPGGIQYPVFSIQNMPLGDKRFHTKISILNTEYWVLNTLLLLVVMLTVVGCDVVQRMNYSIEGSIDAINRNKQMVECSTQAIALNEEIVSRSNQTITHNAAIVDYNTQVVNRSSQAIEANAKVINDSTQLLEGLKPSPTLIVWGGLFLIIILLAPTAIGMLFLYKVEKKLSAILERTQTSKS